MNTRFLSYSALAASVLFMTACTGTLKSGDITLDTMKKLSGNHALVVACPGKKPLVYEQSGIKPLYEHLKTGDFRDCYVYDKVTGKASALILVYGGASGLYTKILSKEAIPVLEKHKIRYEAVQTVDYILNNNGTDKCPMEQAVQNIKESSEAYSVLKDKFIDNEFNSNAAENY